jgi:N-acyl homoserine lactone hydrolase
MQKTKWRKIMANWTINVLDYGVITCPKEALTVGVDVGLMIDLPYLGFLLNDGEHKILVDCGINERFIVDGKAWGNFPAKGGVQYVINALEKHDTRPEDIEMVLYTHLHNDHTGACHLFKNAKHVFQCDEWKDLVDPLPSMKIRGDFDPEVIPTLVKMDCLRIDGDIEIFEGIKMIKTPGHTAGSSTYVVSTEKGDYILTGDTAILRHNIFPKLTETTGIDGKKIKITPAPDNYGPAIPSSLVYNHYEWYKSVYRIQAMLKSEEFALCGHELSIFNKQFPA